MAMAKATETRLKMNERAACESNRKGSYRYDNNNNTATTTQQMNGNQGATSSNPTHRQPRSDHHFWPCVEAVHTVRSATMLAGIWQKAQASPEPQRTPAAGLPGWVVSQVPGAGALANHKAVAAAHRCRYALR